LVSRRLLAPILLEPSVVLLGENGIHADLLKLVDGQALGQLDERCLGLPQPLLGDLVGLGVGFLRRHHGASSRRTA
jgi:hypothetical protein